MILFNNIRLRKVFSKDSYKNSTAIKIIGGVTTGFIISIFLFSILFGFTLWPGFEVMIIASLTVAIIPLIITFTAIIVSKDKFYRKRIISHLAISSFILIVFNLMSDKDRVKYLFRDSPELITSYSEHIDDISNTQKTENFEKQRKAYYKK